MAKLSVYDFRENIQNSPEMKSWDHSEIILEEWCTIRDDQLILRLLEKVMFSPVSSIYLLFNIAHSYIPLSAG